MLTHECHVIEYPKSKEDFIKKVTKNFSIANGEEFFEAKKGNYFDKKSVTLVTRKDFVRKKPTWYNFGFYKYILPSLLVVADVVTDILVII